MSSIRSDSAGLATVRSTSGRTFTMVKYLMGYGPVTSASWPPAYYIAEIADGIVTVWFGATRGDKRSTYESALDWLSRPDDIEREIDRRVAQVNGAASEERALKASKREPYYYGGKAKRRVVRADFIADESADEPSDRYDAVDEPHDHTQPEPARASVGDGLADALEKEAAKSINIK